MFAPHFVSTARQYISWFLIPDAEPVPTWAALNSYANQNCNNLPFHNHHLLSLATPSFSVRSCLKSNLSWIRSWLLVA